MSELIPLVRGQLLDEQGQPHLGPLLAETPCEVVDFLLGEQGTAEWWIQAGGKDRPLMKLDLVWMEQEDFDNLGPWEG